MKKNLCECGALKKHTARNCRSCYIDKSSLIPSLVRDKNYRRTYKSWEAMRRRCDNKKDARYKDWGGRGISYDKRWSDFKLFISDMGIRPEEMSLDRINNDSNYSKENCKWSTVKEQNMNKRNSKKYL